MQNKFVIYLLAILLLIASSIGTFYYIKYKHQVDLTKTTRDSLLISAQNTLALESKLNMKADSLQSYFAFVKDLQSDNLELLTELKIKDNKFVLLTNKYELLLDSISILNDSAFASILDSIITINFSGEQNKVVYSGNTQYDIQTKLATYSISIIRKPVKISNLIYLDSNNNVKSSVYADNILIREAETIVDSSIFLLIQNNGIEQNYGFWDALRARFELNNSWDNKLDFNAGVQYKIKNFNIYYKYLLTRRASEYGISWEPSIKDIILLIK